MGTRPSRSSPVISASEIGQYTYCANAWYLQRCGHEPDSPLLERGTQLHHDHGTALQHLERREHNASRALAAGLLVVLLALLLIIFEVVL
jgi:hypothetical protein